MTIAIAGLIFASGNPRDQDESCFVGRKDKTGFQSIQAIQGNLRARWKLETTRCTSSVLTWKVGRTPRRAETPSKTPLSPDRSDYR